MYCVRNSIPIVNRITVIMIDAGKYTTMYINRSGTTSEDIINPIASARITTAESFNFTFGTVTIKAKMPKGDLITTGRNSKTILIYNLHYSSLNMNRYFFGSCWKCLW